MRADEIHFIDQTTQAKNLLRGFCLRRSLLQSASTDETKPHGSTGCGRQFELAKLARKRLPVYYWRAWICLCIWRKMFGTVSENADEVDNQMQTDEARRTIPSLFSALSARNWSRAEQLIDVGEGINFQKLNGWTVLHEAVAKNAPIRIVERLIVQGDLDVNTQDVQLLNTPLHYAAIHNVSPSLVQLLLSHRADPLSKAIGGLTPLSLACDNNASIELVQLLIDAGADMHSLDDLGFTPLHWAIRRNADPCLIEHLLKMGSDPNMKGQTNRCVSPLELSVKAKLSDNAFRRLLRYGARVELTPGLLAILERETPQWHCVVRRVEMLLILARPGSVQRLVKGMSPLRVLPIDIVRSIGTLLYGIK